MKLLKNVKTASELVLGINGLKENNYNDMDCLQIDEDELYEMYLKLHVKFGGMQL